MIDVKIPYKPNDLAGAYNEAMQDSNKDWVLLLDHDIFLATNKNWYSILVEAIKKAPEDTALITCKMPYVKSNRAQYTSYHSDSNWLEEHIQIANYLYKEHGTTLQQVKDKHIAGAFMLINKKAWTQIRFKNAGRGIKLIDWDFCDRILKKGFKIFVLPGLYMYHGKEVKNI